MKTRKTFILMAAALMLLALFALPAPPAGAEIPAGGEARAWKNEKLRILDNAARTGGGEISGVIKDDVLDYFPRILNVKQMMGRAGLCLDMAQFVGEPTSQDAEDAILSAARGLARSESIDGDELREMTDKCLDFSLKIAREYGIEIQVLDGLVQELADSLKLFVINNSGGNHK